MDVFRLSDLGRSFATRERGAHVLNKAVEIVKQSQDGVIIDLGGVTVTSFSFADEAFAKLIGRVRSREFGDKRVIFASGNPDIVETLQATLEVRRLRALRIDDSGQPKVLGHEKAHLETTFRKLAEVGTASASELSSSLGVRPQAMSNRLAELTTDGIVRRDRLESGRSWTYQIATSVTEAKGRTHSV